MAGSLDLDLSWDTPGDRLKWCLVIQMGLSAFLSDSAAAAAVLGLVAVVWTQRQLLSLFIVVAPAYILADVFWLLGSKHGFLAWAMALLQLGVKISSVIYAYQWLQATSGSGAAADYQSFGPGSGAARQDPFQAHGQAGTPHSLNGTSLPTTGYQAPAPVDSPHSGLLQGGKAPGSQGEALL